MTVTKNNGRIDPRDWGASGDDTQLNDAEFAAMVAAVPAESEIVLEGGSSYAVSDPVVLDRAGMRLVGPGQIHQKSPGKPNVLVSASGVTVEGVKARQVAQTVGNGDAVGIKVEGPSAAAPLRRVNVGKCQITSCGWAGIQYEFVRGFRAQDNDIYDTGYIGIIAGSGASKGIISKNNISDIQEIISNLNAYGITITRTPAGDDNLLTNPRASDILVTSNVIDGVETWHGLDNHGGRGVVFDSNIVSNCYRGVSLGQASNAGGQAFLAPMDCSVSNNSFDSGVDDGSRNEAILLTGAANGGTVAEYAAGCSIDGNTIYRYGSPTLGGSQAVRNAAVWVRDTIGLGITDNSIRRAAQQGITISRNGFGTTISGNTFTDIYRTGGQFACGVRLEGDNITGSVVGNQMLDGGWAAPGPKNEYGLRITTGASGSSVFEAGNNFEAATVGAVQDASKLLKSKVYDVPVSDADTHAALVTLGLITA